jgi:hypothetical protein
MKTMASAIAANKEPIRTIGDLNTSSSSSSPLFLGTTGSPPNVGANGDIGVIPPPPKGLLDDAFVVVVTIFAFVFPSSCTRFNFASNESNASSSIDDEDEDEEELPFEFLLVAACARSNIANLASSCSMNSVFVLSIFF